MDYSSYGNETLVSGEVVVVIGTGSDVQRFDTFIVDVGSVDTRSFSFTGSVQHNSHLHLIGGSAATDGYLFLNICDQTGSVYDPQWTGLYPACDPGINVIELTPATVHIDPVVLANTGSIAGAGLISSPIGSYPSKPTFAGKGYFAFAAGYLKNKPLPIGLTTFLLKTDGLFSPTAFSFASITNESLVLTGAGATLKGTGKVNGSDSYGFLLSVFDGHSSKTSDKLRMKIWDKNHANAVFYDSQKGEADDAAPTAVVRGGVITISKSGGSPTAMDMNVQQLMEDVAAAEIPAAYELYNAYPNPFNPSTTIRFDLPEATKVRLVVYDMLGREVAVLADGERPAGQYNIRFDASRLSSGMYIYRLQTGNFTQTKKLMLMK